MPSKVKIQAKDVAEAISKGLRELGLRREQAEVTVLQSPSKGFLGIGAKPAIVEIRQKRWSSGNLDAQIYMDVPKRKKPVARGGARYGKEDKKEAGPRSGRPERGGNKKRGGRKPFVKRVEREAVVREKTPKENEAQLMPNDAIRNAVIPEHIQGPLAEAKAYLEQVLIHMGIKVENLNAWWDAKQQRILLTFDCDHPAIVIGREGKTLESIQYLATLAISRHFDKPISVITDTQNYWRKAEDKIDADISRAVSMIQGGNSVFRFRPMSAQLRRYIHRALENNPAVVTTSEGEGRWRKVTVRPRPADMPVKETEACEQPQTYTSCECEDITPVCECTVETVSCPSASKEEERKELLEQVNTVVEKHLGQEQAPSASAENTDALMTTPDHAVSEEKEVRPLTEVYDETGATCQAEMARTDGESESGCSDAPVFEQVVDATTEENGVVEKEDRPLSELHDETGATCQAEMARTDSDSNDGCGDSPIFESPTEEKKQENS